MDWECNKKTKVLQKHEKIYRAIKPNNKKLKERCFAADKIISIFFNEHK